jgi:hypothetical protein
MKLSNKSQKTYEALVKKSNYEGRMPSLKRVAVMLQELEVSTDAWETESVRRNKSEGSVYYTSGGTRTYEGVSLSVYSERDEEGRRNVLLSMDSSDEDYSYENTSYARTLVSLVDRRLSGEVLEYDRGLSRW